MTEKSIKTYGQWSSPVTPELISKGLSFSDLAWNGDGTLVWRERRGNEGKLVVQPPDGEAFRLLNSEMSTSGGVGYGGGSFTVSHNYVYFVESESKRIYRQALDQGTPYAITPAFGAAASPQVSPDGRYLLFVHSYEDEDNLAVVDTQGKGWPQKISSGYDFYMHPRWHPQGEKIAWISWVHPQMPWDGTSLKLGVLSFPESSLPQLSKEITLAGDDQTSIFQPQFSPDGRYLAYVSDQSGWWQIYLYDIESDTHRQLTDALAEHGQPAWQQEMRTYGFSPDGKSIYYLRNQGGIGTLWQLDLAGEDHQRVEFDDDYTWFEQIAISPAHGKVGLIASGGQIPHRVITYQPGNATRIWRRSQAENIPRGTYVPPQHINWQGLDGEQVCGMYYHPQDGNDPSPGLPPLIVLIHGGPTSQRVADFQPRVQFFASRGYAVLQPNYRGSTGYGRAYRDALNGKWGILDVEDAVSGARHLSSEGKVDGDKLVIMGGSAGGYTVLQTLVEYPGVFTAGISYYGIANQLTFVTDVHKFERHYSDSLLGPLPQKADLYRDRSPIFAAENIRDPIAIFQGGKDRVVSPDQAESLVTALKEQGVPHVYHLYPEEGHVFHKQETVAHFYRAVDDFLKKYVIYV